MRGVMTQTNRVDVMTVIFMTGWSWGEVWMKGLSGDDRDGEGASEIESSLQASLTHSLSLPPLLRQMESSAIFPFFLQELLRGALFLHLAHRLLGSNIRLWTMDVHPPPKTLFPSNIWPSHELLTSSHSLYLESSTWHFLWRWHNPRTAQVFTVTPTDKGAERSGSPKSHA